MKNISLLVIFAMLCCFWGMAFATTTNRMLNSTTLQTQTESQKNQVTPLRTNPNASPRVNRGAKPLTAIAVGNTTRFAEKFNSGLDEKSLLVTDNTVPLPVIYNSPNNTALLLPMNDNCTDVTPVPLADGTPLTFTGDNTGATSDCSMLGFPEVWEAITISQCMDLKIDYCGTDPVFHVLCMAIVQGCPCGSVIRPVTVNFNDCPEHNGTLVFGALPAGTYYLPVYSGGGATGPYRMNVTGYACPPPATNDNCANAILIGNVTSLPFTTLYATFDGVGTCISSPNIWYIYTASCTGNAVASLRGSRYDTKIAIYDGASCNPLGTELGCNDNFGGMCSEVIFSAITGHQYMIEVGGSGPMIGNGFLTTSCAPPPPNDNCTNVTPVTLTPGVPLTFNGDNTGASNDCPINGSYPEVWHAITTNVCMDISIDYCGTNPVFTNVFGVINIDCPCADLIYCSSMFNTECPDGNYSLHFASLLPGTYYIPVLNDPEHGGLGQYTLNVNGVECPPAPPNDNCVDVTPLPLTSGIPLTFTGDNTGATNDCPALGNNPQVWVAFTTTEALDVSIDYCGTSPNFSTVYVALANSCPCGDILFAQQYNFFECGDGNVTVKFFVLPAGTYYVPIYTGAGSTGPYTININGAPCAPQPANDLCANAIPIAVPSTTLGTTMGAEPDGEAPICYTLITAPSVWYSLTGTGNQITATTCAEYTNYDTRIDIYKNSCSDLVCVSGNDDSCTMASPHYNNSTATFCAEAGVTYYLMVQGYGLERGNFQLDVSEGAPCQPPPPTPICDPNSLYGQSPTPPGGMWNFLASDTNVTPAPYIVTDNFAGVSGDIYSVRFWGLDIYFSGGFYECNENPVDFRIIFYEDNGGYPGSVLSTYTVTVVPTQIGLSYSGFDLKEYVATLDPPYTATDGWISIQGASIGGDVGDCWFYWANSKEGDGMAYQNFSSINEDLAFCLGGAGCIYTLGDINSDGLVRGGDVTYAVRYFKGIGTVPPDSCYNAGITTPTHWLYTAGDVNGDCLFKGSDVTRLVSYFKGISQLVNCHLFPPPLLREQRQLPTLKE